MASRKKQHKMHSNESFNARLKMEEDARREVDARLRAAEITFKNQGRIK